MTTQALLQTSGSGARGLALGALLLLLSLFLSSALLAAQESDQKTGEQPQGEAQADVEKEGDAKKAKGVPVTAANLTRAFQPVPGAPSPLTTDPGAGEWFMEWSYAVNNTEVRGNQDRSFLHEGVNNLAEYSFLHKRPIWDIRKLEAMGLFRYTDDPRIDPEVNSVQRSYLRLSGPTFETNFGDYLANYSRFSFNQNIKGINVWKRLPVASGLRLVGTAGVFQDRWGSVFKGFEDFTDPRFPPDPQFPSKPYTRMVLGTRVEQYLSENGSVAFNFSQGNDILRSLPREAQLRPIDNQVISYDTAFQLGRDFRFAGELAFSYTEFDKRIQRTASNNYAGRFEVSHRWRRLSWRLDFARFLPNFFSLNARQVQDLQDSSGRISLELAENVSLDASFRYTYDNLPGRPVVVTDPSTGEDVVLTNAGRTRRVGGLLQTFSFIVDENGNKMTTFVRSPEVRVQMRRLPPGRSVQLSVGYREREFETSNKASFSAAGNPLFSDRKTRIPFIDLSWSGRSTILGLGYEYRQNRDRARPSSSTFTNRFVASYRGTYFWGDWVVSPSFRFETEPEDSHILRSDPRSLLPESAIPPGVVRDPLFPPGSLSIPRGDQTRTYQGSLVVDFPKYFSLETLYRELNAELLSPFTVTVTDPMTGSPLNERLFGNGGYDRPYFRAALTYKIKNSEDYRIIGSFERNVSTFLSADPTAADTRSFRENVVQLAIVIRWRR